MNRRIVILDDDEDTLEFLSILLQAEGYEVHRRDLLFKDLAEVERLAPDLMILDLFMGAQRAGWDFLQRFKACPTTALIPLILCTAGRLTPDQESITRQQDIPVVYKPFDLNELTHLVGHLLGSPAVAVEETCQAD